MQALAGLSSGESSDVPFLLSLLQQRSERAQGVPMRCGSSPSAAPRGSRWLAQQLQAAGPPWRRAEVVLQLLARCQPADAPQRKTILAAGGAAALAAVLADGGDREAEQAARATANLAADETTRATLVDQGVCRHLASVLRRRKVAPVLREAACRALAALTTEDGAGSPPLAVPGEGSRAAERAANEFVESGGTAGVIDCLQQSGGDVGAACSAAQSMGSSAAAAGTRIEADSGGGGGEGGGSSSGAADDLLGHHVHISGVAARPELNGQSGVVHSFHTSSGRYHVRLDDSGEMVALRPACVHKVSAAALAAAMADGTNTPLAKAAVRAARALANHRKAADDLMRHGVLRVWFISSARRLRMSLPPPPPPLARWRRWRRTVCL